jgi:hypothetical protein
MTQVLPITVQPWPQATLPLRPVRMQVSLAFVEHRVNVWLRFGQPVRETTLDRWRRVATFEPNAVCCRVKWIGNDYGTALWQLMVLQAPMPLEGAQRIAGEQQVKAVLEVIDAVEALGIDPAAAAVTYWRTVGNRLAARQPLPDYTPERHAAHLARGALR